MKFRREIKKIGICRVKEESKKKKRRAKESEKIERMKVK
jgi:hypothetical protein